MSNKGSFYCLTKVKATIGILSLLMVGCTTGSKYKHIENYYTNSTCSPVGSAYSHPHHVQIAPLTTSYDDDLNSCETYYTIIERPVYHYDSKGASMGDLSRAIAQKMQRKVLAAYNEQ